MSALCAAGLPDVMKPNSGRGGQHRAELTQLKFTVSYEKLAPTSPMEFPGLLSLHIEHPRFRILLSSRQKCLVIAE